MKEHIKVREPADILRRKPKITERDSLLSDLTGEEIAFIPIDQLIPFKNQARINFDEEKLRTLTNSIEEHGIRQPLTVLESDTEIGKYEVVSGERRLMALQRLNYSRVPCIIIFDRNKAEEIALIENIQRENLHPIELGRAYSRLYSNGLNQEKISNKLGVPRTQVVEYLKFAEIPFNLAQTIIEKNITKRSFLRKISSIKEVEKQELYLSQVLNQDSVEAVSNRSTLLKIYYEWGKLNIDKNFLTKCPSDILENVYNELNVIIQEIQEKLNK